MTPEEIKIEEAARIHANLKEGFDRAEEEYYNHEAINAYESFKAGVKSPEAKEYHTKGMYTEEELNPLFDECFNLIGYIDTPVGRKKHPEDVINMVKSIKQWFKQNKNKQ